MFHAENSKEQDQTSQEFQFIGSALDDRLEYVAGLFYFREDGREINPWDVTLGLRHTEDEKEVTILDEDPRIGGAHTAADDWSKFTTDLVIGYQLNDDTHF